jgi:hypothetical protein
MLLTFSTDAPMMEAKAVLISLSIGFWEDEMAAIRMMAFLGFLFVWQLAPAQDEQIDMEAMMRWSSADVVRYHIVGEYQAKTNVIGGGNAIGYADVTDRVVIDLRWKLSESGLVGTPVILNEKSTVKNLRDYEPKCLPPKLKGDYEHFELLSVKNGLGGALEMQVKTTYPAAEVVQFCTGKFKPIPAKVKTEPQELVVLSPVMFAMPLPDSDDLRISKDKKSIISKKDGWTWTFTPTLKPKK